MTVTVYRSTDAGAPTLNAVQGSLINVLDACLVNGYGSKTAAGWTKPFSATNRAAYQMPVGSTGHWLVVDETAASNYAYFHGYESMTSITAGFNRFPGPAQNAVALLGYLTIGKSDQAVGNTAARPWILVTNGNLFYFWCNSPNTQPVISSTWCNGFAFGQFITKVPNDAYNTILIGNSAVGSNGVALGNLNAYSTSGVLAGHYSPRNWTQTGSSYQTSKISDTGMGANGNIGTAGLGFPNPADGKFYIAPVHICEYLSSIGTWRGTLPGLYNPLFAASGVLNDGDIISDIDGYPGKTFEAHFLYSAIVVLFEISDTW